MIRSTLGLLTIGCFGISMVQGAFKQMTTARVDVSQPLECVSANGKVLMTGDAAACAEFQAGYSCEVTVNSYQNVGDAAECKSKQKAEYERSLRESNVEQIAQDYKDAADAVLADLERRGDKGTN